MRSDRRVGAEAAAVSVALLVAMAVVWMRTDDAGGPRVADQEGQPYAFLTTTADGRPVGYDPCTPIRVAVNPQGAPEYYDELVDTGLRRVAEHSGLEFERVGDTDDRELTDREARFSARDSDPVLIAWSDAEEDPRLEGDVAGVGGSVAVRADGTRRYVTGSVVLDTEAFGDDTFGLRTDAVRSDQQSVLDHELGHLVGLDHVDDPGELMHGENVGQERFGPGDRQGLAVLGDLPCG